MAQHYFYPPQSATISGTVTTTDAAMGTTGGATPASAELAGMDVGGTLTALTGTSNGLKVDGSAVTQPVSGTVTANAGTGTFTTATTDATATGSITSTQSVSVNTAGYATVGMQVTGTWSGTIVVEASVDGSTWTSTTFLALSSGTPATQFSANNTGTIQCSGMSAIRLRGNTVASGTAAVYLRANTSTAQVMLDNPLPGGTNTIGAVQQNGTWTMQPGNTANTTPWLATIAQGGNSAAVTAGGALKVDGSAVTQGVTGTVSVSNLPGTVDTNFGTVGASTQRTAAQIGNATGAADFNSGAAGAQTLRAVLATRHESVSTPLAAQLSNGSAAVDYNSGAAGAATLRSVLATRHEAVATPLAAQLSNGSAAVDYNSGAAGTATLRTVLATRHESVATPLAVQLSSGSAAISYDAGITGAGVARVIPAGRDSTKTTVATYDYTGGSVTTSAYTQVIASTTNEINRLHVFDSSGSAIIIATGANAAEVDRLYIPPGGSGAPYEVNIPASTRVSIKALDATASTGRLIITGLK